MWHRVKVRFVRFLHLHIHLWVCIASFDHHLYHFDCGHCLYHRRRHTLSSKKYWIVQSSATWISDGTDPKKIINDGKFKSQNCWGFKFAFNDTITIFVKSLRTLPNSIIYVPGVQTSFGQGFSKKSQKCPERRKNLWKFVYILAKQYRSPFNLTNFIYKKFQNSNFAQIWDFH